MDIAVAVLTFLVLGFVLFAGWAAVYFFNLEVVAPNYGAPWWRWCIFWGVYMTTMLGWPVVFFLSIGYTMNKITGG